MPRPALLALATLGALGLSAPGHGGIWGADPDELRPLATRGQLRVIGLQVKVRGIDWTGPGHRRPGPAPARLGLGDALDAPAGDWTDLTLHTDGPVTVTVAREDGRVLTFEADVGDVTVPLDDPDARRFTLDLALPDPLPADPDARAALVRDGLVLVRAAR